jgi:hypothetical protein
VRDLGQVATRRSGPGHTGRLPGDWATVPPGLQLGGGVAVGVVGILAENGADELGDGVEVGTPGGLAVGGE